MRHRLWSPLAATLAGALVVSGGLIAGAATVANAGPAVPSAALSASVAVAPGATLVVNPVHPLVDTSTAAIAVDFDSPNTYTSRQVSVQYEKTTGVWASLAVARMDKSGKLTAKVPKAYAAATFRAVALAGTYKKKSYPLVATRSTSATTQWATTLYDFAALDAAVWANRSDGTYHDVDGSRQCSAPTSRNVTVSDGKLRLAMKRADAAESKKRQAEVATAKRDAAIAKANKAIADAGKKLAAAKTSKAKKAAQAKLKSAKQQLDKAKRMSTTKGCPQGVFTNAMISTEGKVAITSGIVSARIKFPKGQGMHGSAWLQSADGQEIDFIESYGKGKGITNVIHTRSGSTLVRTPSTAAKSYVLKSEVKKSSWWDRYHDFSVEFSRSQIIFRVDGKVTRTMKGIQDRNYFLVLSLLSSDWELPLLKKSSVPSTMLVDWIRVWEKKAA